MNAINKILVPIDFSQHSAGILEQALEMARKAKAQLILLHVYPRPTVSKSGKFDDKKLIEAMESSKLNRLIDKIKIKYNELLNTVSSYEDVKLKFIYSEGIVVDKILETCDTEQVNLIFMGTRGVKGIEEYWGTKTAEICLKTKLPVLALPYHRLAVDNSQIAFAYDLKEIPNIETLNIVKLFSSIFEAKIHIITVQKSKDLEAEEAENLENLRTFFQEYNPEIKTLYDDDTEKKIYDYLHTQQISMLVIFHRHRSFMEDMFHESLTAKFTFHSNIPVLTLDERE